jgi:hypothetical protein
VKTYVYVASGIRTHNTSVRSVQYNFCHFGQQIDKVIIRFRIIFKKTELLNVPYLTPPTAGSTLVFVPKTNT